MIKIKLVGQLGNQMFQYAVCRTLAEKYGYDYFIDKFNSTAQILEAFPNLPFGEDKKGMKHFIDEGECVFKENVYNIKDDTELYGFYQVEEYFIENEENIKKWFNLTLNEEYQKTFDEISKKYTFDEYCYIHYRGGDYPPCWNIPIGYYNKAKEYMLNINSNLKFVILTNDVDKAEKVFINDYIIQNVTQTDFKYFFADGKRVSNHFLVDFKLLQSAKYFIMTNSSFSWWPAWLAENQISVAPYGWLNYGTNKFNKSRKFMYL